MAPAANSGIRLLLLTVALLAAGPVAAQTATPPTAVEEGKTLLHLSEQADRTLTQDRLQAVLRAEVLDADAGKVQAQINKLMTDALARAKTAPAVKANTGSYSVYQERLPGQATNQPLRWRGSQTLTLSGTDAAAILSLAGDLQTAGLVMSGMAWQLAPETVKATEDELTTEALTRIRLRADRIAGTLGMVIENLKDIRVGNAGGVAAPRFALAMTRSREKAEEVSPVAAAGEERVIVTVDADVVMRPKK